MSRRREPVEEQLDLGDLFPATIRIGPVTYEIVLQEDLRGQSGQRLMGQYQAPYARIYLDRDLDPTVAKVVLWHEVIHAILEQAGVQEEHPENMVDALAYGVIDLLNRNPFMRE